MPKRIKSFMKYEADGVLKKCLSGNLNEQAETMILLNAGSGVKWFSTDSGQILMKINWK